MLPTENKHLRYHKVASKVYRITDPSGNHGEFAVQPRNGIGMIVCPENFVATFLGVREGCCGQPSKLVFTLATDDEIKQWIGE